MPLQSQFSHLNKGPKPTAGNVVDFAHVTFIVGNARQSASWYCTRMGFKPYAEKGLETGSKHVAARAVKQGDVIFVFQAMLEPHKPKDFGEHLAFHGDGVKDVAFLVQDLDAVFEQSKARGAKVVRKPWSETDEYGTIRYATIQTFGDTTHTFVDRSNYNGWFLPGFVRPTQPDPVLDLLPELGLLRIDHVVANQPEEQMLPVVQWYEKNLTFHRFWSVDDDVIHTDYSALRSVVIANYDETIKMPINEPAPGRGGRSQCQEFVDYWGSPGIQHIAMKTTDIVHVAKCLRERGVESLNVPKTYYTNLKERLKSAKIKVREDMDALEELNILVDYDEEGYLLQLFTGLMQDRPTLFLEVIEKHNHEGFGAGNFRAVFEAIEAEQKKRGTLMS